MGANLIYRYIERGSSFKKAHACHSSFPSYTSTFFGAVGCRLAESTQCLLEEAAICVHWSPTFESGHFASRRVLPLECIQGPFDALKLTKGARGSRCISRQSCDSPAFFGRVTKRVQMKFFDMVLTNHTCWSRGSLGSLAMSCRLNERSDMPDQSNVLILSMQVVFAASLEIP